MAKDGKIIEVSECSGICPFFDLMPDDVFCNLWGGKIAHINNDIPINCPLRNTNYLFTLTANSGEVKG